MRELLLGRKPGYPKLKVYEKEIMRHLLMPLEHFNLHPNRISDNLWSHRRPRPSFSSSCKRSKKYCAAFCRPSFHPEPSLGDLEKWNCVEQYIKVWEDRCPEVKMEEGTDDKFLDCFIHIYNNQLSTQRNVRLIILSCCAKKEMKVSTGARN